MCRSTGELSSLIVDVPLLLSIDQWGYVPFPLLRLTPHSLSRLVQQMLTGEFVAHRRIPVDDEAPEPEKAPIAPAPGPAGAQQGRLATGVVEAPRRSQRSGRGR